MSYEKSKIYKLICDDGFYYYGSTIASLNNRLSGHKTASKDMSLNSKVYSHLRIIGLDKVRIELVKSVPCKNRTELRSIENTYIESSKLDSLCLNTLRSHTPIQEKIVMEKNRQLRNKEHRGVIMRKYYETNKDKIRERGKKVYEENKEIISVKQREYNEKNKDSIKAQKKQYYNENKERICKEKRDNRAQNKEEHNQKGKEYREKNREHINQLKRQSYKEKKGSPI